MGSRNNLRAAAGRILHLPGQATHRVAADLLGGADLQAAIQTEQHYHSGVDARAMVGQRRADGFRVTTGHRILETEVGRQHAHRIVQLTTAHIEQLLEHPATDAQLLMQLILHGHSSGSLDREIQGPHHHKQEEDQYPGDTSLKAMVELHAWPS